MKKITYIILLLLVSYSYGQDFPCGTFVDWEWWKRESYDNAYTQDSPTGRSISSPFHSESSKNRDIERIIDDQDFLPKQGWVLLDKVFGCAAQEMEGNYPHFVLYNKYRGVIRVFANNFSGEQNSHAIATLEWSDPENGTSLLKHQNVIANPDQTGTRINDKGLNYIDGYQDRAWFVTEFLLGFDPTTSENIRYSRFRIIIHGVDVQDMEVTGTFEFTTQNLSGEGKADVKEVEENKELEFLKDAKKFTSQVPNKKAFEKGFKHIDKALDSLDWGGPKVVQKLARGLEKLNTSFIQDDVKDFFTKGVSALSELSGPLGTVVSVLELFTGKANENNIVEIAPTISNGSMQLSGTLTAKREATKFTFQVPGSRKYNNDNGLTVYDCPLGVITLEESPRIKQEAVYLKNFVITQEGAGDKRIKETLKWTLYYNFRLDGDIKIAHNKASGTRIIATKAQLLGKFRDSIFNDRDKASIISTNIKNGNYNLTGYENGKIVYATKLMDIDKMKETSFILPGGLMTTQDIFYYHSSFPSPVPLDFPVYSPYAQNDRQHTVTDFKLLPLNTPSNRQSVELYLKIFVILMPTDATHDQTPIFHSYTYDLNDFSTSNMDTYEVGSKDFDNRTYTPSFFPFMSEQLPYYDINQDNANESVAAQSMKTDGDIFMRITSKDITYKSSEYVLLKEGLHITIPPIYPDGLNPDPNYDPSNNNGSLSIKIDPNIKPNHGGDALVLNEYFEGCDQYNTTAGRSTAAPTPSEEEPVVEKKELTAFNITVYPNPARNQITVAVKNGSGAYNATIMDMSGRIITHLSIKRDSHTFDISSLKSGIYFIRVNDGKELITKKFIKRN